MHKLFKENSIRFIMFGKKECGGCGKNISEKSNFCQYCGISQHDKRNTSNKNNYGMLGEEDSLNEFGNFSNSLFGGVGGKMMGKMFENAMKILEKEIDKEMKRKNQQHRHNHQEPRTNFQLFINGQKINTSENSKDKENKQNKQNMEINNLPTNILKTFSGLPRKNPKTEVRRFSDKVVYEINMPGVNSLKDISITKLENNIEIRGISKSKAYQKMIPIDFPITAYNLSKGKLVLEFEANE
jgi:HSP20 family molecular chaperone IbpA